MVLADLSGWEETVSPKQCKLTLTLVLAMEFKPPRGLMIDENVSNDWTLFKQTFDNFLLETGN